MKGVQALVTGGGGFVGANLVRALLARGAAVHALVRRETDPWRLTDLLPRLRLHEVDLTDGAAVRATVRRVGPDLIFHLAKHRGDPAHLDYRAAYDANLGATLNLLEAATALPALRRFVHAGSSLEYALTETPLSEDVAPVPATVHGVTKAAASQLCQQFFAQRGVPAVVLRFFTVYGPWEGPTRFVPTLMRAALAHESLRMTRPGLMHDWIYVGDVVDACLRAAAAAGVTGEILNVGTGTGSTNEEVVRLVESLHGASIRRDAEPFPDRAWDTGHWVADVSKTARLLGWRSPTSLRDGLERTLDWFKGHLDLYLRQAS